MDNIEIYNDNLNFSIVFYEGYSFRHLIELLKNMGCKELTFYLSANGVYLFEHNDINDKLITVQLYGSNLVEYEYSSSKEVEMISLNIKDVYDEIKSIQKKKALKIFKSSSDPSNIRIQKIDSYKVNVPGGTLIPIIVNTKEKKLYGEPKYDIESPVCTAPINDFCDICKELALRHNIMLTSSSKGVAMFGSYDGISKPRVETFGKYDHTEYVNYKDKKINNIAIDFGNLDLTSIQNKTNDIYNGNNEHSNNMAGIHLSSELVKSLLKLKNISTNGIVQFYIERVSYEQYSPLGIYLNVGSYGRLKIFIR